MTKHKSNKDLQEVITLLKEISKKLDELKNQKIEHYYYYYYYDQTFSPYYRYPDIPTTSNPTSTSN